MSFSTRVHSARQKVLNDDKNGLNSYYKECRLCSMNFHIKVNGQEEVSIEYSETNTQTQLFKNVSSPTYISCVSTVEWM